MHNHKKPGSLGSWLAYPQPSADSATPVPEWIPTIDHRQASSGNKFTKCDIITAWPIIKRVRAHAHLR